MNASTPALTREGEVQTKIQKVRTFSRAARTICAALFGFGLVGTLGILLAVGLAPFPGLVLGPGLPGLEGVSTTQLTTLALKAWAFLVVALSCAVSLAFVRQLYHLFGNLAAAAIYTPENVRRVRSAGLLTLLAAVLEILVPIVSATLVAAGIFDASVPFSLEITVSWQSVGALISAGLILLASWIMDVGLYEKDHADELRRDADLVI